MTDELLIFRCKLFWKLYKFKNANLFKCIFHQDDSILFAVNTAVENYKDTLKNEYFILSDR